MTENDDIIFLEGNFEDLDEDEQQSILDDTADEAYDTWRDDELGKRL